MKSHAREPHRMHRTDRKVIRNIQHRDPIATGIVGRPASVDGAATAPVDAPSPATREDTAWR